jgi:hypothetical protein
MSVSRISAAERMFSISERMRAPTLGMSMLRRQSFVPAFMRTMFGLQGREGEVAVRTWSIVFPGRASTSCARESVRQDTGEAQGR